MPDPRPNVSFDTSGRQIIDPTILTTQAQERAVDAIKELFDSKLVSMDKAIALLQANADKLTSISVVEQRVTALRELMDERFVSVALQFSERDTRTEQLSLASKVAVDAALQAAKEAVGEQNKMNSASIAKSEAGFTKQIDQIGQLIAQQAKASDDKNDDMKARIGLIEGKATGSTGAFGWVVGAVGLLVAMLSLALLAFQVISSRGGP